MRSPDLEQALGTHLETTWLDVSSATAGYKWETAGFSASVAVKVGFGVAPELFTTWTSWIHLTISPPHVRGGPAGPQKNLKPVARHSQGSVCKTATKKAFISRNSVQHTVQILLSTHTL